MLYSTQRPVTIGWVAINAGVPAMSCATSMLGPKTFPAVVAPARRCKPDWKLLGMVPVEMYVHAMPSTELSMNCQYEKLTIIPEMEPPGS